MKKSILTQLALAGLASGMVALSVDANEAKPKVAAAKADTAKLVKADTSKHAEHHEKKMEMKAGHAGMDSTKAKPDSGKTAAMPAAGKHACKGHNECKGQGGCGMTDKDLAAAAKKMGMAVEKAGKAHACKGHNECKGLGGCKM